jgi:hypothetical protein
MGKKFGRALHVRLFSQTSNEYLCISLGSEAITLSEHYLDINIGDRRFFWSRAGLRPCWRSASVEPCRRQ